MSDVRPQDWWIANLCGLRPPWFALRRPLEMAGLEAGHKFRFTGPLRATGRL